MLCHKLLSEHIIAGFTLIRIAKCWKNLFELVFFNIVSMKIFLSAMLLYNINEMSYELIRIIFGK